MRNILLMFGLADMPMPTFILVMTIIVLATLAAGWIADLVLGDGGFGVLINALLMLIGAVIGTMLWRRFGFGLSLGRNPAMTSVMVATGSGLFTLILGGILRRWI